MRSLITLETVRTAYGRYARFYNFVFGAIFHPGRERAIRLLDCQAQERILEVGVGTGLSLSLYPKNVKVVGIDLSADMLSRAKLKVAEENLQQVESLMQMDAQNMTFPDNYFDKVVAMYLAPVVPDCALLMKEMRRVCKPEGKIIFLNHFQNENSLVRLFESSLRPFSKYLGFTPDFNKDEFLKKTQFQVQEEIPVNLLNYWTLLIGKNNK